MKLTSHTEQVVNAYFIIIDRYDVTDIQEGVGKKRFIIDVFHIFIS